MTRIFDTLEEAALEVRRDLAKGTQMVFTRVQQLDGLHLDGRERQGYSYAIREVPDDLWEVITLGQKLGFKDYIEQPQGLYDWGREEVWRRISAISHLGATPTEIESPLLNKTLEGNHPSYTYGERLYGMTEALLTAIQVSPDTRRAFWPMFLPQDSLRASAPTRIPCTIGYQAMLRAVGQGHHLLWFYLQRSCDFDRFWLMDVWFASQLQRAVAKELAIGEGEVRPGVLYHYIISLHSFGVSEIEIY